MIKLFLSGIVIGTANIIPGVSGGTMAVVLGIYDAIIDNMNTLFSKSFLSQFIRQPFSALSQRAVILTFFIPLALGGLVGIKGFATVADWALQNHPFTTTTFLFGIILGSIYPILKHHQSEKSSSGFLTLLRDTPYVISIGVGIVIMLLISFLPEMSPDAIVSLPPIIFISYMFVSGMIAAGTMIIPGISGSLMLMILGSYFPILHAVNTNELSVIFFVLLGAGVGLIVFTKFIEWCLIRYPSLTHGGILGLVAGTLFELWPGHLDSASLLFLFLGVLLSSSSELISLVFPKRT